MQIPSPCNLFHRDAQLRDQPDLSGWENPHWRTLEMWPWQCHWTGWDQAWRGNQHSSLSHNPEHQQAQLRSQHIVAVSKNPEFSTPVPLCHPLRVASAPQLQLPSCEQAGHNKGSLQIFRDFQCLELFCESALKTEVLSYSTIVIFFKSMH